MTTAIEVLSTLPAQVMLFDRVSTDFGATWKTVIFLKENRERIQAFGDKPNVSIRTGCYRLENLENKVFPSFRDVHIVNVLIGINNLAYYESFLNYCADDRLNVFEGLSTQTNIELIILDEDMNVVKRVNVKNQIRRLIEVIASTLYSQKNVWTDDQFDIAKAALIEKLPDLKKLWRKYSKYITD